MKATDVGQHHVKVFAADSVKAESGGFSWTISTGAVDRDRDTLAVDGWDLADYRNNPIVLWMHDAKTPVARAETITAKNGVLKARIVFPKAGISPEADKVRGLVEEGFIKAASVGFIPLEWTFNEERGGIDFKRQSLLEFSLVSVPSNPEALIDAKAAGHDLRPLLPAAEAAMTGILGSGLWVPKAQAEAAFKALAEPRVTVAAYDPEPAVVAAKEALQKRGRVLSAENESRVRGARDAGEAVRAALDEVLAQMPEAEEPKSAPVLVLAPSPKYVVDPSVVQAAVRAAVSEAVREQVNAARGRLD